MTHPSIRTAAVWAHGPRVRSKDFLLNLVEEGVEDRQVQHTCESNVTSAALAPKFVLPIFNRIGNKHNATQVGGKCLYIFSTSSSYF